MLPLSWCTEQPLSCFAIAATFCYHCCALHLIYTASLPTPLRCCQCIHMHRRDAHTFIQNRTAHIRTNTHSRTHAHTEVHKHAQQHMQSAHCIRMADHSHLHTQCANSTVRAQLIILKVTATHTILRDTVCIATVLHCHCIAVCHCDARPPLRCCTALHCRLPELALPLHRALCAALPL